MRKERWIQSLEGICFAFQLLTTIPIRKQIPYEAKQIRYSIMAYPLVGACLGMILYGLMYVGTVFSPLITSLLLLTTMVIYSGGLHLDGWMDCSDAFFSYKEKEKKWEVMKDSRIGAFAAISVIFLLGWKLVLISEVLVMISPQKYGLVFIIPFLSRLLLGLKMYYGKLARNEGMAFAMRKYSKKKDCFVYVVLWFAALLFFPALLYHLLILTFSSLLFYLFSSWFDQTYFGGISGDTLGASVEGGDLWLWLTLYLLLSFGMG